MRLMTMKWTKTLHLRTFCCISNGFQLCLISNIRIWISLSYLITTDFIAMKHPMMLRSLNSLFLPHTHLDSASFLNFHLFVCINGWGFSNANVNSHLNDKSIDWLFIGHFYLEWKVQNFPILNSLLETVFQHPTSLSICKELDCK